VEPGKVSSELEVLPVGFWDEGRVFAVPLDERAHKLAERQELETVFVDVVAGFGDQLLTKSAVLVSLLDLGVGERDQSGTSQVFAVARELTVEEDLIPVSLGTVDDEDTHLLMRERLAD